jgi:hypothetical protein
VDCASFAGGSVVVGSLDAGTVRLVHSFAQNLNKLETFKSNVFVKFRM